MRVTFLAHSGFLVELEGALLLFDWWKGALPPLPDKPLLVFVSHRHEDHFSPAVFTLDDGSREVLYLLGKDFRLTPRTQAAWGMKEQTALRCHVMKGGQILQPLPGITVEALPSTDAGVAFVVTAEGATLFHAGDLNWWHWEGADKSVNNNMAANFRRYVEPLRQRTLDLAMVPLDPRLGPGGFLGPRYLMELCRIRRLLPMHQWEEFSFTNAFLSAFPGFSAQVVPIVKNGQVFDF